MKKVAPALVIVFGILLFAFGAVRGVSGIVSSLSVIGEPWTAPGAVTQQLEPGNYALYERVSSSNTESSQVTLRPEGIRVQGPSGDVTTRCISCGVSVTTVTVGAATYQGVVAFEVTQAGSYTFTVVGDGQQVVVGPTVGEAIGASATGFGLAALGGIVAVIGVVWLIIALVTGRSKPQPVMASAAAPVATGSWYPDPEDPSQLRWWDGQQWTDYRSPRNG